MGFGAWALIAMRYPIAPLVIGVILGESFRRALLVSGGDLSVFVSRPASALPLAAIALLVAAQIPILRRPFCRCPRLIADEESTDHA